MNIHSSLFSPTEPMMQLAMPLYNTDARSPRFTLDLLRSSPSTTFQSSGACTGGGGGGGRDDEVPSLSTSTLQSTSMMSSSLRCVPDAAERHRRAKTKDRVVQMHLAENERRQQEYQAKEARLEEKKRAHDEAVTNASLRAAWQPIIFFIASALAWPVNRLRTNRREYLMKIYGSYVHLQARRWLRAIRERLELPKLSKPTIAMLRADRMLGLFPDAQLQHLIQSMTLRYYFPNEPIVFSGVSDEEECYCLCQGAADVMVNGKCVFTFQNVGAVFGSIGMISGEPRTATVTARGGEGGGRGADAKENEGDEVTVGGGAFVWIGTRSHFESYNTFSDNSNDLRLTATTSTTPIASSTDGMAMSITPSVVGAATNMTTTAATTTAHDFIKELREKNFRSVYHKQLQAAFMQTAFPELLRDLRHMTIENLVIASTPFVFPGGTTLSKAAVTGSIEPRASKIAYVLRGKLMVSIKRGTALPLNISPEELVRTSFLTSTANLAALTLLIAKVRTLQTSAALQAMITNSDMSPPAGTPTTASSSVRDYRMLTFQPEMFHDTGPTTTTQFVVREDTVIGEISVPVLLNTQLIVFSDATPFFHVEAGPRGTDALLLERSTVLKEDVLELDTMRQNMMQLQALLLRPLSAKAALRAILFDIRDVLPVLRHVNSTDLPLMNPIVLRPGDMLFCQQQHHHNGKSDLVGNSSTRALKGSMSSPSAGETNDDFVYLIVNGELEVGEERKRVRGATSTTSHDSTSNSTPCLFPPLAVAYFGDTLSAARAVTRVDLFRMERSALVTCVRAHCDALGVLASITTALSEMYATITGRAPPLPLSRQTSVQRTESHRMVSASPTTTSTTAATSPQPTTATRAIEFGSLSVSSYSTLNLSTASSDHHHLQTIQSSPSTTSGYHVHQNRAAQQQPARQSSSSAMSTRNQNHVSDTFAEMTTTTCSSGSYNHLQHLYSHRQHTSSTSFGHVPGVSMHHKASSSLTNATDMDALTSTTLTSYSSFPPRSGGGGRSSSSPPSHGLQQPQQQQLPSPPMLRVTSGCVRRVRASHVTSTSSSTLVALHRSDTSDNEADAPPSAPRVPRTPRAPSGRRVGPPMVGQTVPTLRRRV